MIDDNESREPTERSANHTSRGLTIFFVVLACYALSPVPMAWGLEKLGVMDRAEAAFETFYKPVEYLAVNVVFVGAFYQWQAKFFGL
ncbi:MAG: hypothetical protein IAG10_08240 [Planctomycetaceae bacterium]|nr:hypothetical protein [Planctomycetaceae bacterium]